MEKTDDGGVQAMIDEQVAREKASNLKKKKPIVQTSTQEKKPVESGTITVDGKESIGRFTAPSELKVGVNLRRPEPGHRVWGK